jgi:ubiquinone/menaquinone biosynthesis C-methylase UbiE
MEKFKSASENIYNPEITKRYYQTVGEEAESGLHKTEADKYFESLIPQDFNGKTILDHGCGNGRYCKLIAKRGAKKVLGVDLSPVMIEEALKRKIKDELPQMEFVLGDINDLPVRNEQFDFIFSRFSVLYSSNIKKVMKEIGRALKKNGEVLIETNVATIKNNEEAIKKSFLSLTLCLGEMEVPIKNYAITLDDYKKAFEEAGLEVKIERSYPAHEIKVNDQYKDVVSFDVFIFKLKKD